MRTLLRASRMLARLGVSMRYFFRRFILDYGTPTLRPSFLPFLPSRSEMTISLYTLLMKRWFDSTHTFYLPYREFTLDPISFGPITGTACVGDPVPFDTSLNIIVPYHLTYIERSLSIVPIIKGTHTIKIDTILSYYTPT